MSNEESSLGAARRTPRQGVGGSPVGSWLTVGLAVVAVIVGFLILQNITDDGTSGDDTADSEDASGDAVGTDDTLVDLSVPESSTTTSTTTPERVVDGSSVLVANANTVGGSAGNMTRTLELAGYTVIDPVNASGANITDSVVYFDGAQASAEAVAGSVARDLGGVDVLPLPTPAPTENGDLGGAGVLVQLGDEQAGRSLEELAPAAEDGATAAPDPAGDDAATDEEATEDDATEE